MTQDLMNKQINGERMTDLLILTAGHSSVPLFSDLYGVQLLTHLSLAGATLAWVSCHFPASIPLNFGALRLY